MKLLCFAVRDNKAEHFNRPIFSLAAGEALRSFQMECESAESMLHRFPDDFSLFRIGEFDQVTGEFVPCEPVVICRARDFVSYDPQLELEA